MHLVWVEVYGRSFFIAIFLALLDYGQCQGYSEFETLYLVKELRETIGYY